jgi:hypothetical protein
MMSRAPNRFNELRKLHSRLSARSALCHGVVRKWKATAKLTDTRQISFHRQKSKPRPAPCGDDLGFENRSSLANAKEATPFGGLASRLSRRRNVGAELQRSRLLAAASAESDCSSNGRDKDGPLHRHHLLKGYPSPLSNRLASNFRGHVSAELQRSGLFTTASAQSNSSDDDGEHDCTLHSIFSYVVLALPPALNERTAWRQGYQRQASAAPALHDGTRSAQRPQPLLTKRSAP